MSDERKPPRHSNAGVDDTDLRLAARELADAHEMLLAAHALTERGARAEAIKVAVGRLALASRAIDVVVDRRVVEREP